MIRKYYLYVGIIYFEFKLLLILRQDSDYAPSLNINFQRIKIM